MDINTKNSSGMMNGMPPVGREERKVGPIIGVLVIVLILIVAALYFFGQRLNTQNAVPENNAISAEENSANASSSTDIQSINADLDAQLQDVDYSF